MPLLRPRYLACVAVVSISFAQPLSAAAQSLSEARSPSVRLRPPVAVIPQEFSEVVSVVELAAGVIVVADRRELAFYLVRDLGRDVKLLGRNGEGPNEYRGAFAAFRLSGDTIALFGGRRGFLRDSGRGDLLAPLTLPGRIPGLSPPRGADTDGAIYWIGDLLERRSAGARRALHPSVLRWRPGEDSTQVVATITDHDLARHGRAPYYPFAHRDAWLPLPDGSVAVLSADEYRLRLFRDGRLLHQGPFLAYESLPVGAADRNAYREDRLRDAGSAGRATSDAGTASSAGARNQSSVDAAYPDAIFPETKPPFVEDGLFRAPSGEFWVVRSMPHGQAEQSVDILDARGARKATLRLPPHRRLVALERGGVYLVRLDEEGLQWLERYEWPMW